MKMFIFFFYPLSCKAMFLLYRKLNFDSYPLVVGLVAIKAVNVKSFFNFSGCASRFCEIEKKIQKCFFFSFSLRLRCIACDCEVPLCLCVNQILCNSLVFLMTVYWLH